MPANRPTKLRPPPPAKAPLDFERFSAEGLLPFLEFTRAITATVQFDEVLDSIVRQTGKFLQAEASVWFLNQPRTRLTLSRGKSALGTKEVALSQQPLIKEAFGKELATTIQAKNHPAHCLFRDKNVLLAPLSTADRDIGLLVLVRPPATPFTPSEKKVAFIFSREAALAIANATRINQLIESNTRLSEHTRKLQRLFQVLDRFSKIHQEVEVLELIPRLACDFLGYNYAIIEQIEGRTLKQFAYASRKPFDKKFSKMVEARYPRAIHQGGIVEGALNDNQPYVVTDPAADPRIQRRFVKEYFADLVLVPLVVSDRQVGLLSLAHHIGTPALQPADLELLNVFSKICTYALANAGFTVQQEKLAEIASTHAKDVKTYVSHVINNLPSVVGGKSAVIALPNDEGILTPVAATSQRILTKRYRQWLADLPVKDYARRYPTKTHPSPTHLPFLKNSLTVPILYEEEVLGLVQIFDRISGTFSKEHLQTTKVVSTRIGFLIKNLELVASLSAERKQFAALVESSADGILSLDGEGHIQFFNPAMEDLSGYKEGAVLGRTCAEVFDPRGSDDSPFDFTWLRRATERDPDTDARDATIKTKSGTRRWVGISAAPLGEGEATSHTIVVIRDMARQHAWLKRQQEFVSIASHELRTPITALLGYLSLMQNSPDADRAQLSQFAERANNAAVRLSELVEDLLNVARIEEGRLTYRLRPVRIGRLIQDLITGLQPALQRKHLSLSVTNPLTASDVVLADQSKLSQVLANLMDNAIKYTPPGGRIDIITKPGKHVISVSIKDNGIGIHPDNLERIFEKFFREYTELSVEAGGTGLGLFITKQLIEQQGGKLTIKSAKNKGTIATVQLSRHRPSPKKRPQRKSRAVKSKN